MAEMAAITGMPAQQVAMLFVKPVERMSLTAFLNIALSMAPDNAQLLQLSGMVQLAASGTRLDAVSLAAVFGMEPSQARQLLGLHMAGKSVVSLAEFTGFLVQDVMKNEEYSSGFTAEQKEQLTTMDRLVQLAASGTALDPAAIADAFGMEEKQVTLVFRLYFGRESSVQTMSVEETVDFILADPVMKDYMDEADVDRLQTLQKLVKASVSGERFTSARLAQLLDMDADSLKMLFTLSASREEQDGWTASVQNVVAFLLDNSETVGSAMDSGQLESLTTAREIIDGAVAGTSYTAEQICDLTGMTGEQAQQLYLLHTSRHGDTSGWTLSVKDFIDFVNGTVLTNEDYADRIDGDTSDMLSSAKGMVDAVIEGAAYTPEELCGIFAGLTDGLDAASVELMYLYADSLSQSDPNWTMTLEGLFRHLVDRVLEDPRFDSFIDEEMRESLLENQTELEDGKLQLVGSKYSRLVITTTYLEESAETTAFVRSIEDYAEANLDGEMYLIGSSPMNCEMQQIFDRELAFITLLTACAIFLIVALTFRSLSIPLILVLLVQCGVYITVTVTGIMSGGMYFLALLIVECILMGATIDYGILFTNYYCENRRTSDIREALKKAYAGSIHTIMTSGLVLVSVTAVVGGLFEDATVSAIVRTISIGSFCAIVLILFILPGVLAACDRLVIRKKNRAESVG